MIPVCIFALNVARTSLTDLRVELRFGETLLSGVCAAAATGRRTDDVEGRRGRDSAPGAAPFQLTTSPLL